VIDFDSLAVMDFDGAVIYDNDQFSQELQLLYNGGPRECRGGYLLPRRIGLQHFDIVLGELVGGIGVTAFTGGDIDTQAWSVFADVTYALTDRWSVSLGGR
jgi:iron complex outermembrane receptor protein